MRSLINRVQAGIVLSTFSLIPGNAQTQDPITPLEPIRQAREQAKNSSLSVDGLTTTSSKIGFLLLVFFSLAGVVVCGHSLLRAYRASRDDNREDMASAVWGFFIGIGLCCLGGFIGYFSGAIFSN